MRKQKITENNIFPNNKIAFSIPINNISILTPNNNQKQGLIYAKIPLINIYFVNIFTIPYAIDAKYIICNNYQSK